MKSQLALLMLVSGNPIFTSEIEIIKTKKSQKLE
jgi:hypothetical protein